MTENCQKPCNSAVTPQIMLELKKNHFFNKKIYQKCLILLHYDFLWQLSNLTENLKKPCFSAIILLIHHFWSFLWTLTVLWMLLKCKVLFYFSGICWRPTVWRNSDFLLLNSILDSNMLISQNCENMQGNKNKKLTAFFEMYLFLNFEKVNGIFL